MTDRQKNAIATPSVRSCKCVGQSADLAWLLLSAGTYRLWQRPGRQTYFNCCYISQAADSPRPHFAGDNGVLAPHTQVVRVRGIRTESLRYWCAMRIWLYGFSRRLTNARRQ